MVNEEWINISSPLTKIGNSYSVRIPMSIVNELGVKEGQGIMMKVKKMDLTWPPEVLNLWFRVARECRELDNFSDDKVILLSRLAHIEGKSILETIGNNLEPKNKKESGKKMAEALSDYRKYIQEEFGEKVYNDFIKFRKIVQPKLESMNKS